jgi:LCP family protein required for cell wall assembly
MGSERINILLLGSDTDAKFQGAYLAQTVIIVTIDPATKYIGMLSIPRDMQIAAPGYRASKLDEVFSFGFQSKKSNNPYADGAGLTIAALKANFGIPIHHYAWVGLDGFIKVIDTTGGVDVDVLHPMLDDVYPDDIDHTSGKAFTDYKQAHGYKRLYIAPGPQHLTGIQALEYVRTRHSDLVGDFGRSIRQQQVLNQLKARLATSDSIGKLPELAKSMDGYVKTSMELSDLINLANFARTIDTHTIERLVLSPPYSDSITNSSNFAPVCARIIPALEKMFGTGTCVPQVNNGSLSGLASTSSLTASVSTNTSAFSLQVSRQAAHVAQLSATSLSQAYGDIFGLRALLNLTFLVTFESLDSMIL